MSKGTRVTLYILGGLMALTLVLLGGFLVPPSLFDAPQDPPKPAAATVAIPEQLPAPVDRWLRAEYPDGLPVADSLVMRGRGVMRIGPVPVPMRHVVEIRPGEGFARRMDLTWYGIAFAHGKDTYVGGHGKMVTPVGEFEGDKIDQGANIVNWLEVLAVPGVLATSEGVRWEPVDENSARLVFPLKDAEDSVVVHFDPKTGAPAQVTAQRYKDADTAAKKLLWTAGMRDRKVLGGLQVSGEVDALWEGADKPWATFGYTDVWVNAATPNFDAALATRAGGA